MGPPPGAPLTVEAVALEDHAMDTRLLGALLSGRFTGGGTSGVVRQRRILAITEAGDELPRRPSNGSRGEAVAKETEFHADGLG
jgi:hypothetical protein